MEYVQKLQVILKKLTIIKLFFIDSSSLWTGECYSMTNDQINKFPTINILLSENFNLSIPPQVNNIYKLFQYFLELFIS